MNSIIEKNVLILGGYGAAGQAIAELLSEQIHGRITLAGRNFAKAQACVYALQESQPPTVSFVPLAVDVTRADQLSSALRQQDLVVVCVHIDEAIAHNLVQTVLDSTADYIDIAPSEDKYRVFKQYQTQIIKKNKRFVLDAGADPGLPGWLARYAVSHIKNAKEVVLFARYRDKFIGRAGIQDILEHSLPEPKVFAKGAWKAARPWHIKCVRYPGGFGLGLSIPLFLEELEDVPRSTGLQKLSLYHAGSNFVTDIILICWKLGLYRFAPISTMIAWIQKALKMFTPEPTGGALMAHVKTDTEEFWIKGWHHDLYRATAIPAVLAALKILQSPRDHAGSYFLGDWVEVAPFRIALEELGFHIEITPTKQADTSSH